MSLEVIKFVSSEKTYITDEGEFYLNPPYAYVVDQFVLLLEQLNKVNANTQLSRKSMIKQKTKSKKIKLTELVSTLGKGKANAESLEIMTHMVHTLLKEKQKGTLQKITAKTLRMDFFNQVVNDFFQEYGKQQTSQSK